MKEQMHNTTQSRENAFSNNISDIKVSWDMMSHEALCTVRKWKVDHEKSMQGSWLVYSNFPGDDEILSKRSTVYQKRIALRIKEWERGFHDQRSICIGLMSRASFQLSHKSSIIDKVQYFKLISLLKTILFTTTLKNT